MDHHTHLTHLHLIPLALLPRRVIRLTVHITQRRELLRPPLVIQYKITIQPRILNTVRQVIMVRRLAITPPTRLPGLSPVPGQLPALRDNALLDFTGCRPHTTRQGGVWLMGPRMYRAARQLLAPCLPEAIIVAVKRMTQ